MSIHANPHLPNIEKMNSIAHLLVGKAETVVKLSLRLENLRLLSTRENYSSDGVTVKYLMIQVID